jgi:hypothetical protein
MVRAEHHPVTPQYNYTLPKEFLVDNVAPAIIQIIRAKAEDRRQVCSSQARAHVPFCGPVRGETWLQAHHAPEHAYVTAQLNFFLPDFSVSLPEDVCQRRITYPLIATVDPYSSRVRFSAP